MWNNMVATNFTGWRRISSSINIFRTVGTSVTEPRPVAIKTHLPFEKRNTCMECEIRKMLWFHTIIT
ncbi:hypothetical protein B4U80_08544 [Leptotrombidium deliense]|uniref:Uncharacterized protein n=1 Tax=Leptotrombidium deliense TaxID=299467 RepID=A0A443RUQ3_9ACAR|nr:hypothetical protein B4U80_08544 [Leptotrombidium deliense]